MLNIIIKVAFSLKLCFCLIVIISCDSSLKSKNETLPPLLYNMIYTGLDSARYHRVDSLETISVEGAKTYVFGNSAGDLISYTFDEYSSPLRVSSVRDSTCISSIDTIFRQEFSLYVSEWRDSCTKFFVGKNQQLYIAYLSASATLESEKRKALVQPQDPDVEHFQIKIRCDNKRRCSKIIADVSRLEIIMPE